MTRSVELARIPSVTTCLRPDGQSTSTRSTCRRVAEPEVQRKHALRQVARLAVVPLRQHPAARRRRAPSRPSPLRFEVVPTGTTRNQWIGRRSRQVADQHLRLGIEVVGHDVEIAVAVEIEDDRGAAAERAPSTVILPGASLCTKAGTSRSEQSTSNHGVYVRPPRRGSIPSRNSLSRNFSPAIVQQQRVDAVAEWDSSSTR